MKGHIGVGSKTKLIHSAVVMPANVHDSQPLPKLLHGAETRVWSDSPYIGQQEAMRRVAPKHVILPTVAGGICLMAFGLEYLVVCLGLQWSNG